MIEYAAVMANDQIALEEPITPSTWQRNRPVLWVYAVAVTLVAVVGASLVVASLSQQRDHDARDCITISNDGARLACYVGSCITRRRSQHVGPARPQSQSAGSPYRIRPTQPVC